MLLVDKNYYKSKMIVLIFQPTLKATEQFNNPRAVWFGYVWPFIEAVQVNVIYV